MLVIAGIVVVIIVFVVIYRNQKNKRGLYTFVYNGDVLMTSVGNNDIKINDPAMNGVINVNDEQSK